MVKSTSEPTGTSRSIAKRTPLAEIFCVSPGRADKGKIAVAAKKCNVGVDIVIGGNGVQDEIEAAGVLLHLVRVAGDNHFVGAEAKRIFLLAG